MKNLDDKFAKHLEDKL